jgi:hypothetical protein
MTKDNTLWIQLTPTEANALMMLLDGEMESRFRYEGLDLKEWETLDKILAYHKKPNKLCETQATKLTHMMRLYHKFKTWYMENCNEQISN